MPPSQRPFASRLLLRVGFVLWWCAALTCLWEGLALQVPTSPYHFGVLAGPVGQLRATTFALGTAALLLSSIWPDHYGDDAGKLVLSLLLAGAGLQLGPLVYAASHGLMAVQLLDPRDDVRWCAYARALGHALSWLGVGDLVRRSLFGAGQTSRSNA